MRALPHPPSVRVVDRYLGVCAQTALRVCPPCYLGGQGQGLVALGVLAVSHVMCGFLKVTLDISKTRNVSLLCTAVTRRSERAKQAVPRLHLRLRQASMRIGFRTQQ